MVTRAVVTVGARLSRYALSLTGGYQANYRNRHGGP